jgi:hypothetical protein
MASPNVICNLAYERPAEQTLASNISLAKKAKYVKLRKFYGSTQNYDFLKYVESGIGQGDYLSYSNNPEKSSGVFNAGGLLNKNQKRLI